MVKYIKELIPFYFYSAVDDLVLDKRLHYFKLLLSVIHSSMVKLQSLLK